MKRILQPNHGDVQSRGGALPCHRTSLHQLPKGARIDPGAFIKGCNHQHQQEHDIHIRLDKTNTRQGVSTPVLPCIDSFKPVASTKHLCDYEICLWHSSLEQEEWQRSLRRSVKPADSSCDVLPTSTPRTSIPRCRLCGMWGLHTGQTGQTLNNFSHGVSSLPARLHPSLPLKSDRGGSLLTRAMHRAMPATTRTSNSFDLEASPWVPSCRTKKSSEAAWSE